MWNRNSLFVGAILRRERPGLPPQASRSKVAPTKKEGAIRDRFGLVKEVYVSLMLYGNCGSLGLRQPELRFILFRAQVKEGTSAKKLLGKRKTRTHQSASSKEEEQNV